LPGNQADYTATGPTGTDQPAVVGITVVIEDKRDLPAETLSMGIDA
jgi:hypothetical protein